MSEATLLVGEQDEIVRRSQKPWKEQLLASPPATRRRLEFLAPDHHRIRNLAVRRLGEGHGPLSVESIAEQLAVAPPKVEALLEDLDRGRFFLTRDRQGWVNWAFPFASEETPHAVDLGGERPTWGA